MKRVLMFALLLSFALVMSASAQSNGNGNTGVPNNFNHQYLYLQDADGDGIPNCQDPDYVRPVCDSTRIGDRYTWGHRFANTVRDGVGSTVDHLNGLMIRLRDRIRTKQE